MDQTKIVVIAGGSGSGKSTIVELLSKQNAGLDPLTISMDHYYKDQSHLPPSARDLLNFDHPDCIDIDLLVSHLKDLSSGKSVLRPSYDFHTHTRKKDSVRIEPRKVILVDGILGLHFAEIRAIANLRLYVEAKADIRLCRRFGRDVHKRGRSMESVLLQYQATVAPMHEEFVSPSKQYADFIIPWTHKNDELIGLLSRLILSL